MKLTQRVDTEGTPLKQQAFASWLSKLTRFTQHVFPGEDCYGWHFDKIQHSQKLSGAPRQPLIRRIPPEPRKS